MILPSNDFWKIFKETPGAFSVSEAIALYNICLNTPNGDYIELGSHKGKSSKAIALALKSGACLYCVEPEFENADWLNTFWDGIKSDGTIKTIADYSMNVLPNFDKLTFAFVDSGTHSDDLVMQESKELENKIIRGGVICYHDKGSQFTRVDEAYNYILSTGKYEEIQINWQEIFDYVKEHDLEKSNNSWHLYPELPHPPNFVGALIRK